MTERTTIEGGSLKPDETQKQFKEFVDTKERFVDADSLEDCIITFCSLGIEMFHQIITEDDINEPGFSPSKELLESCENATRDWNDMVANPMYKGIMEFCKKHPEYNFKRVENQAALVHGRAYARREMKLNLINDLL